MNNGTTPDPSTVVETSRKFEQNLHGPKKFESIENSKEYTINNHTKFVQPAPPIVINNNSKPPQSYNSIYKLE